MRSIQDVGVEILNDNPANFYIFIGQEYGVKCKYIDIVKKHYGGKYVEFDHVQDVLKIFKTKQLIPLVPTLYVVRYDEEFVSSLDGNTAYSIEKLKIVGTIICIYQDEKHSNKLDKYLPNYTVSLDNVDAKFVSKYLKSDFPALDPRLSNLAVQGGKDYGHSKQIAYSMSQIDSKKFNKYTDQEVLSIFGYEDSSSENEIKLYTASKNYAGLVNCMEKFEGSYDNILYAMMNTMVELDKIQSSKYSDSPLRKYSKNWTRPDIYYMFMHCYNTLLAMRSSSTNQENLILYVFSLLNFSNIPDLVSL